jgi:hypothetical protein
MLGANGIVIVEAEQEVKPGDEVPVQIIGRVF